jgi:hypothetical protein
MEDPSPLRNRPATSSSDEIIVDGECKRGVNDCWLLEDDTHQPDEHILLDKPAEMSVHERFLVHLPIEQASFLVNLK